MPNRLKTTPPRGRWKLSVGLLFAFALHLYALAAMVSTVLGPTHFHTETRESTEAQPSAATLMAGWQDFRRTHHLSDTVIHRHSHNALARHHHDADDATVVRIGADERDGPIDDAAASAVSPIVLALLGSALPLPVTRTASGAGWSTRTACAFASCPQRRLDRPPIA